MAGRFSCTLLSSTTSTCNTRHIQPWLPISFQTVSIRSFPHRGASQANLIAADFTKAIRSTDDSPAVPQIVAHRGQGGDHPENTMGAFRSAVGLGANALECDVQLSRDHAVVLSHVGGLLQYPIRRWFVTQAC